MPPPRDHAVLVMPTGFRAGPWAIRSLVRAGFRVVGAIDEGFLTGGRSLACPRPRRYPRLLGDPSAFSEAVGALCREEGVDAVLPAGEDVARVFAEGGVDTDGALVIGPTPAQYAALCDKEGLAAAAARAGVPHPTTAVVRASGVDAPLPDPPVVVKPRVSGEDLGDADAAVAAVTTAERDRAIRSLLEAGRDAVVQELVSGRGWIVRCVRAEGLLELVAFRVRRQHPRRAGTPSLQSTAPAPPELVEATERLLGLVDYHGPASVCCIERDGRFLVHDVNLRLSGTLGGVIRSGLDVPRRAVELALGIPGRPSGTVGRHVTYLRLDGELGALRDALRGRRADGDRASAIAGSIVRAAVDRDWMIDPPPDPFWLGRLAGLQALGLARRARRSSRFLKQG